MMKIQEFCDMNEFEAIMNNWAKATGLATVAVGADGEYISGCYNFTDFCIKYTRGSQLGKQRCEKCDREGSGVYHCHAGLVDFSIDLVIEGTKVGAVIGGQVLPENADEDKFRMVAREIGVDPDNYIDALRKVNVRTQESIDASANLLGQVLNNFVNAEYSRYRNKYILDNLESGIKETNELVKQISRCTGQLQDIQKRQKIVAINASIEAARVGQAGKGFAVVADEVKKLSDSSSEANSSIEHILERVRIVVSKLDVNEQLAEK